MMIQARLLAAAFMLLVTVFSGCKIVEDKAKASVDSAAGKVVVDAVGERDAALASRLEGEATSRRAAGEAWPWMATIAANWEMIAAAMAGIGGILLERFIRVRRLIRDKQYAGAASEVLSIVLERIKTQNPGVRDMIAEVAAHHPAVNGKSVREMIQAAGFKPAG